MTAVGVATAGFQVEGGYNERGSPTNNWAEWELRGRAQPSGPAVLFWDRPEIVLDRAAALGCDRFRLSVEWARVQPGFDIADASPPPYDETAFDGYARLLTACRERGMEPMVTLHHFTHPRWVGVDLWGQPAKRPLFEDFVRTTVTALGERLVAGGQAPVREWVTLNEVNVLALAGGLMGAFPSGGRRGPGTALRWLDNLLAAHCRAYDIVHDVYEAKGWEAPAVSTNNYTFSAYALDRMLTDLLLARENGVGRDDLGVFLREAGAAHVPAARASTSGAARLERLAALVTGALLTAGRLPMTVEEVFRSPRPRKLDYLAIDWYEPVVGRQFRAPGRTVAGGRRWDVRSALDEYPPDPDGFGAALRQATTHTRGQPVIVVENGLCNMWPVSGTPSPRGDGVTRPEYLRAHAEQVAKAVADGVPVSGYYHWTVVDNYEWGSYTPRFGIHAVERRDGHVTVLDHDAMGHDSASTFRAVADDLRALGS